MQEKGLPDHLSVGDYVEALNAGLRTLDGRILGEVTGIQLYPGRSYLYFSVRDKGGEATLKCFMWKRDYQLSGLALEDGLEVIVSGYPQVYKPNGSLSFQAQSLELVGEGALKAAYEKLKLQLEREGLFSESKKRALPEFPHHVGLITSKDGAAIGDFLTNLGKCGFRISMIDSRVEGQLATQELIGSVRTLRNKNVDVLVIVRGGGSLESFLPFNNEALIREIADFPAPVLVGIGHERDVPLLGLAADRMVSTPTAAAQLLATAWIDARATVELQRSALFSNYESLLQTTERRLDATYARLKDNLTAVFRSFEAKEVALVRATANLQARFGAIATQLDDAARRIPIAFSALSQRTEEFLAISERLLQTRDPQALLKLGYSIVSSSKGVIRTASDVSIGDTVSVRLAAGKFDSAIIAIEK